VLPASQLDEDSSAGFFDGRRQDRQLSTVVDVGDEGSDICVEPPINIIV
jgi:hypothetical protein